MKEIANSSLMMILVVIGLVYIIGLSLAFLKKAYTRCLELGISKETINNVIKSSAVFSIVPAISIVVGFFALIAVFQSVVWPWWRLSVIGSLSYETMASTYTASGMGIELSGILSGDARYFGAIILVMTIGIMIEPLIVAVLAKKYSTGLMKASGSSDWGQVLSGVFFLGMFAVYLPIMIFTDFPTTLTLLTSFIVTIVCGVLSSKLKWLGNFTMAIAMIVGMCSSVLWVSLFK